ncbi:hypothetical protein ACFYY9_26370 [Streptomyces nigra]|uniref:hypothetical protein n=1 Tax=Streptomyces nigra TaxID=1827580 RepID=UPI00369B6A76
MAPEPLLIELDDPIGATVRLPGLGGAIEGELVAVEIRPGGDFWLRVRVQMWDRWRTQLKVGKPSVEGIGPKSTEIWAPSTAVSVDSERGPEVAKIVRGAECTA